MPSSSLTSVLVCLVRCAGRPAMDRSCRLTNALRRSAPARVTPTAETPSSKEDWTAARQNRARFFDVQGAWHVLLCEAWSTARGP